MESWATIVATLLTAVSSVVAVVLTNNKSNRDMDSKLDKQIAIINTTLSALKDEVQKHNNYVTRVPALEVKMESVEKRLDKANL